MRRRFALVVAGVNAYMLLSTRGEATSNPAKLHRAQTAIVLGAQVQAAGRMSTMLADRVTQAAKLWRARWRR